MALIQYNPDGSVIFTTEYANPPRTQTEPPGTPQATVDADWAAFVAADVPTRAGIIEWFANQSPFTVSIMTQFFNGTLS